MRNAPDSIDELMKRVTSLAGLSLGDIADTYHVPVPENLKTENKIVLNSTYKEIAQFLGTTYRHLSRTLKEMETQNIIKCEDKVIQVLNISELHSLSKNPYIKSL